MTDEPLHIDFFETEAMEPAQVSKRATKRQKKKADKEERQRRRSPMKAIEPRNQKQKAYIKSLKANELTFGIGPAGAGKTYVPARVYGEMLVTGEIDKIYLARPNVSKAKHRNGFLPGTLEEKTEPWLIPIFEGLQESMGKAEFERARKEKRIEEVPFEFMQGRTFKNAAAIVDEAENLDLDDLYITLTRQGEGLNMVLCGDIYQSRIPNSGLGKVIEMSQIHGMESVGVIEFTADEIVRSRQAKQWAEAFEALWGAEHQNNNEAPSDRMQYPPAFLKG